MFAGRIFFTVFFYKKYNPPKFGYASTSKRQLAMQIDVAIIISFIVLIFLVVNTFVAAFSSEIRFFDSIEAFRDMMKPTFSGVLVYLLILLLYCFYAMVSELFFGFTIGKRIMELKSVTTGLKKLKVEQIILRNAMKFISLLFAPVLIFVVYGDKKRRWLHDRVALSVVVVPEKIIPEEDRF